MPDAHTVLRSSLSAALGAGASAVKSAAVDAWSPARATVKLDWSSSYSEQELAGHVSSGRGIIVHSAEDAVDCLRDDAREIFEEQRARLPDNLAPWRSRLSVTLGWPLSRYAYERTCGDCSGMRQMRCGGCSGRGRMKCQACSGRRWINCAPCRGSGRQHRNGDHFNCPPCGGSGKANCTHCANSGEVTCTNCIGCGRVDCRRCAATGATTAVVSGSVNITSTASVSVPGSLDPLRSEAIRRHQEVAFIEASLTNGRQTGSGAIFDGNLGYTVAQIQGAGEAAVLVFVGGRPGAFVASNTLREPFRPFFTEAEQRLAKGLSGFIRWGRQRSYGARLFQTAVSKSDPKALKLVVGRSAEHMPSPTVGKILDALVDGRLRNDFARRLNDQISTYKEEIEAKEARIRAWRLTFLSLLSVITLGTIALILRGVPVPWSLDTATPVGAGAVTLAMSAAFVLVFELWSLGLSISHLHDRESEALEAAETSGALRFWQRVQTGSLQAISIGLAALAISAADGIKRDVLTSEKSPAALMAEAREPRGDTAPNEEPLARLLPVGFEPPSLVDEVAGYRMIRVVEAGVLIQCDSVLDGYQQAFGIHPYGSGWRAISDRPVPADSSATTFSEAVLKVCAGATEASATTTVEVPAEPEVLAEAAPALDIAAQPIAVEVTAPLQKPAGNGLGKVLY